MESSGVVEVQESESEDSDGGDDSFFKIKKGGNGDKRGGGQRKDSYRGVEIDKDMPDSSRFRPDLSDIQVIYIHTCIYMYA